MKNNLTDYIRQITAITVALILTFGSSVQMIAFADGDAANEQTAKVEKQHLAEEKNNQSDLVSEAEETVSKEPIPEETEKSENPKEIETTETSSEIEKSLATKSEQDFEFDGAGKIISYKGTDTDVVIPETIDGVEVVEIGEWAFSGYEIETPIISITIPKTVNTIGDCAFFGSGDLTKIKFEGDCPELGTNVFGDIGDATFYCDLKYKSQFESGLDEFVSGYGCSIEWFGEEQGGDQNVDVENQLDKLYSFEENQDGTYTLKEFKVADNKDITQIVVPEKYNEKSVTKIADHAFDAEGKGFSKITSITIPDSITEIGSWAFNKCNKAETIILSKNLKTIGENAFQYCDAVKEINIPASVTEIGDLAFTMCENLERINVEAGNSNYIDKDGVLFNKNADTLINYPAGRQETSYAIPEGTTKIANDAFKLYYGNKTAKLTTVTFPSSLEEIGDRAFMQTKLSEITIIPNVKIGNYAFDQCKNIKTVNVAEGVTEIGEGQLYALENCEKITLPSTLKKIGYRAFDRIGVKEINLPEGLEEIGVEAFECSKLKSITIPSTVKTIGERAFYLSEIEELHFAENTSLKSIGAYAFNHCKKLNNVIIPNGVTTLEDGCFSHCQSLGKIEIPKSVTTFKNVVFAGSGFENISLPDSITTMGTGTFRDCIDLTYAKLPDHLQSLGTCTFEYCINLKKADFPETMKIKSLPADTFMHCESIPSIYLPSSIEKTEACAFSECKANPTVEYANKNLKRSRFDCFIFNFDKIGDSYYELIDAEKQIYKLKIAVEEEKDQFFEESKAGGSVVKRKTTESKDSLCGCQGAQDAVFAPTCNPTFKFKPTASSETGTNGNWSGSSSGSAYDRHETTAGKTTVAENVTDLAPTVAVIEQEKQFMASDVPANAYSHSFADTSEKEDIASFEPVREIVEEYKNIASEKGNALANAIPETAKEAEKNTTKTVAIVATSCVVVAATVGIIAAASASSATATGTVATSGFTTKIKMAVNSIFKSKAK